MHTHQETNSTYANTTRLTEINNAKQWDKMFIYTTKAHTPRSYKWHKTVHHISVVVYSKNLKSKFHYITTSSAGVCTENFESEFATLLDLPLLYVLATFISVHSEKSYSLHSPRLTSARPEIWQLYCQRIQALFSLPSIIWHHSVLAAGGNILQMMNDLNTK